MALDPEFSAVENEIDNAFRDLALIRTAGRDNALWHLVAAVDHSMAAALQQPGGPHRQAAFADTLVNAMRPAVEWIENGCRAEGSIPTAVDIDRFQQATELLDLGVQYLDFTAIFPYAHRRIVSLSIQKDHLVATHTLADEPRFEVYNRLHAVRGTDSLDLLKRIDRLIADRLSQRRSPRAIALDPSLIASAAMAIATARERHEHLPPSWQFFGIELGEFHQVSDALRAIVFVYQVIIAIGRFAAAPFTITRSELIDAVHASTGVKRRAIRPVLDLLTYGSLKEIRHADPALQPILPLRAGPYVLSTTLLSAAAAERNLIALANLVATERSAYMKETDGKEALMRRRIAEAGPSFRSWHGTIPGRPDLGDLDLVLIDETSRSLLLLELKYFIDPAEVRELLNKTEELKTGVARTQKRLAAFQDDPLLLTRSLGIEAGYRVAGAVVSANWIGLAGVQAADVPIINEQHLCQQLAGKTELRSTIEWLETRRYLPFSGDFEIVPTTARVGRWSADWYRVAIRANAFG